MSTIFTLKQGALLPAVELTLTATGFTYDLAEATNVEFRYRKKGDSEVETIACAVTDAVNKKVLLTPTADLVDTVGKFECHVKVTFADGDLYFPKKDFDKFEITENF